MAKDKHKAATHGHGVHHGHHHEEWGTRLGVILAVAGSAVGLGNFLRFPGQAAQNGGGAFMIPYICALLFLGIPIGWAEWTMGRYGGRKGFHSSPSILGVVGKGPTARYLGILGILIPLAVSFYYTYIEAWCLGYFWHYLTGGIGVNPAAPIAEQTSVAAQFYTDFTGRAQNGIVTGHGLQTFIFWSITFVVNIWLVYRGISKGIEKFVSWAMPLMALCAIVVLARVLTLGTPDPAHPDQNVINGLAYMWNPRFDALSNPQTWLAAAGQIFFSLSVGFGVIVNYASYLKKKDDVVLSGLTASATNELFEVGFGGLITLTAAFIFLGTSNMIGAVQGGTFGLGFNTLPIVFAHMGPAGNFIGATWFLMLFIAAITSSISMYQPSLAFFRESLGWDKRRATTLMASICVIASFLVMYYSRGGLFWSTIDDWVGTFMIFVLAMVQIICFSWVFGIERGWKEAHIGAHIRIPWFYKFIMKWVTPVYLIVVFAAFCWQNLGDWIRSVADEPLRQGAVVLVLITTFILVLCTSIGERRWRAAGLDVDGREEQEAERRTA
jgi:SNF family Na+-dependent transporter